MYTCSGILIKLAHSLKSLLSRIVARLKPLNSEVSLRVKDSFGWIYCREAIWILDGVCGL